MSITFYSSSLLKLKNLAKPELVNDNRKPTKFHYSFGAVQASSSEEPESEPDAPEPEEPPFGLESVVPLDAEPLADPLDDPPEEPDEPELPDIPPEPPLLAEGLDAEDEPN